MRERDDRRAEGDPVDDPRTARSAQLVAVPHPNINAEGKSLEDSTKPLTATEEPVTAVAAPATP
jgi:hypothetical protein